MTVTMTIAQKVAASIVLTDAHGNPAVCDGLPLWAASEPGALELIPSLDGFSCEIVALGPIGAFQVTVNVDADLGEGVRPLVGILDFNLVAGEAVTMGFAVSAPIAQ